MRLDDLVAIKLQHLPSSGVFSPGIPSGARDASVSAFTLPNMTFERACTHKKEKREEQACARTHTSTLTHFTEAV